MPIFKIVLFFLLTFITVNFNLVFAQTNEMDTKQNIATSSFELFWPLTAGKTTGEAIYFLKRLKEDLRGMLIFGPAQKANYNILLATKRVLEAEKLISEKKLDLVQTTIDSANDKLKEAETNLGKVSNDKKGINQEKKSMQDRLKNLELFLPHLSQTVGENNQKINQLLEMVKSLKIKVS